MRFINMHAPGVGFADYMRGIRDGQPVSYDQFDPPEDGGLNPAGATFGEWANGPAIKVGDGRLEPGGQPMSRIDVRNVELYVLEGAIAFSAQSTRHDLAAGSWVHVPPEVGHTLEAIDAPSHYLVIHTPA
jgi:hypothetical protein